VSSLYSRRLTHVPVGEVSTKPAQGAQIVYCSQVVRDCPMFEELWSEIADAPGEIFDIPEMQELEEKFDVNEYLNGNYDY